MGFLTHSLTGSVQHFRLVKDGARGSSMSLAKKQNGYEGKIDCLAGDDVLLERLRELGFLRGETVRLVGRAPFGEPLLVEVRGMTIALRKVEAECIRL